MPASEDNSVITKFVDRTGFESDKDFALNTINEVFSAIKKVNDVKSALSGAKSTGGVQEAANIGIKANAQLNESTKAVINLVNQRFASEAKLITVQTDYANATAKNRVEQSKLLTEQKANAQAELAQVGSRERAVAQIKILTLEKDKLNLINAVEKKQYDDLVVKIEKYNNFLKATGTSAEKQKQNIGNYSGAINILKTQLDEVIKKMDAQSKSGNANSATMKKLEQEYSILNKLVDKQTTGFVNAAREIRENQKALLQLDQAGLRNTKTYNDLAKATGKLKDDVSDLTARTKALGSDTFVFDGLIKGAQTLAGAYGVAAGAASLFGNENEDLQKALIKFQAIQTVLNGLQSIANGLQKESSFILLLQTARTKALSILEAGRNLILNGTTKATVQNTAATVENSAAIKGTAVAAAGATTAMRILRVALITSGIGLLLVLLPAAAQAMGIFKDNTESASEAMERLNAQVERNNEILEESVKFLDRASKSRLLDMKLRGESQKAIDEQEIRDLREKEVKIYESYQRQKAALDKFDKETVEGQKKLQQAIKSGIGFDKEDEAKFLKERADLSAKLRQSTRESFDSADEVRVEADNREKEQQIKQIDDLKKGEKKGHSDSLQALKDKINNEFEIYSVGQTRKIALLSNDVSDEKLSYTKRLEALRNFIAAQKDLLLKQEQEDVDNKTRAADREIKHLTEEKKGKSPAEQARINENIKIVQDNLEKDLLLIHVTYADKLLEVDRSTTKQQVAIAEEAYGKIAAAGKEAYEEIATAIEKTAKANNNQININKDKELLQLNKEFNDGKIKNAEEYEQKKQLIEDKARVEELQNDQERIRALEAIYGVSLELARQYYDDEVELNAIKNRKIIEQEEELADKKKELEEEALKAVNAFVEGGFDREKNAIQDLITLNDEKTKREIDAVNASILSEQDKANRIIVIQARAAAQKTLLENRQRIVDQERARFERFWAIAQVVQNVAAAITKDLIGNKALIPFDIAIGAAQIAAILARPIPKFKEGKNIKDKYEGPAIVGDGGKSEVHVHEDGRITKTPSVPTLTHVKADDIILPDFHGYEMLVAAAMSNTARSDSSLRGYNSNGLSQAMINVLSKKLDTLTKVIENKKEFHTTSNFNGVMAIHKYGDQWYKYVEEQMNF